MEQGGEADHTEAERAVLQSIAAGPLDIDTLLSGFPPAQWNRLILAVDALVRRRTVCLRKPTVRTYVVGLRYQTRDGPPQEGVPESSMRK